MDFPANPPRRVKPSKDLEAAMRAKPVEVWAGAYLVAVLESEAAVRGLRPDLAAVAALGAQASAGRGNLSVVALADAASPYDVVSRFFAPGSGISEDPTTGSAHTILAPLFSAKLGRPNLRYHQAYPGRGGDLEVEVRDERVMLRGQAVTVIESRLRL
jgi:predicted PhzF superfamily epimerase YddE/YHI9